jgi:hypothetical protein
MARTKSMMPRGWRLRCESLSMTECRAGVVVFGEGDRILLRVDLEPEEHAKTTKTPPVQPILLFGPSLSPLAYLAMFYIHYAVHLSRASSLLRCDRKPHGSAKHWC